jgi:hypothetical protein
MDAIQPDGGPLRLEPMDASTTDGRAVRPSGEESTAGAGGEGDLSMASADEFLASAMKEYDEGHIDPTLWARATAQSGDDESLVIAAYLSARATALHLHKRDRRLARRANRAKSRRDTRSRKAEPQPRSEIMPVVTVRARLWGMRRKPKRAAAVAGALASVVAVIGLIALPQKTDSLEPTSVPIAAPSVIESALTSPVEGKQSVAAGRSGGASEGDSVPTLEATVQQLKDAGNWNVLVLYASKWTRDGPDNAAAWKELSIGYANLRQFDDAVVAATKAAELSPAEALLWRNVGHLNVTLERLPEAESAFGRALALSADDADALCGAALVALRSGRMKDADAIARRVKSTDGSCPGVSDGDGESVAVIARVAATTKPASSVRR